MIRIPKMNPLDRATFSALPAEVQKFIRRLLREPKRRPRAKTYRRAPISDTKAADLLGVRRGHLNMVINGQRESRSLTKRYQALIESLPSPETSKIKAHKQARTEEARLL